MKCPFCAGPVELPEPKYPAWCPECDEYFYPVAEIGWFRESITVYAHDSDA